jgi:DNA primase catalytic subunit
MNEGNLCTHARKEFMLLKPSQISELILDYDSDEYKTETETVVEDWGL